MHYTQEQLDIEILKVKSSSSFQTLDRIEKRLDSIDAKIAHQFSNFTNYILGIYGIILCATLAHLKGIF